MITFVSVPLTKSYLTYSDPLWQTGVLASIYFLGHREAVANCVQMLLDPQKKGIV